MKYADISGLSAKDLAKKVTQVQTEVFEAKMKNSLGQLADPMVIRNHRRDIARLKTAVTAKAGKAPVLKMSREDRLALAAKNAKAVKSGKKTAAKTKAVKG
jgi:large subunit ribosomal protein L29